MNKENNRNGIEDWGRTLVIGLDGATFDILRPLLEAGIMPNLKQLMSTGASGTLDSVLPTNSAAAWSSFATGKLPSRHGIYEFRIRSEGSLVPNAIVNSTHLRDETIWQIAGRHHANSGIIAVPMTYPPRPLNGFMVTGLLTPSTAPVFTYPEELSDELRGLHDGSYTFDVEWMNYQGRQKELIRDLNYLTEVNLETTLYLAENRNWDFLCTVFVSPDRLQHCLWPFIDPDFPGYDADVAEEIYPLVQEHFAYLDSCIGRILSEIADEQTTVLAMSDHGFTGVFQQMVINDWLAEQGLLKYRTVRRDLLQIMKQIGGPIYHRLGLKRNLTGRIRSLSQASIIEWSRTRAYCPWDQQQGISINLKGREPEGIVSAGKEYEELLSEIEQLLIDAQDPSSGLPLFKQVLRGKDYYLDEVQSPTPDLIVIPDSYLRVAAPRQRRMFDSTGWATGDHALSGIFVASGNGIRQNAVVEGARLIDLAPTILFMLDVPVPSDMDGIVLEDLFLPEYLESRSRSIEVVDGTQQSKPNAQLSAEEEEILTERLKGLGYL